MPIPKPRGDEDEQKFVSRCIASISGEYDEKQAAAICYKFFRETTHSMKHTEFLKGFDACVGHANEQKVPGFPDIAKINGEYFGIVGGRTVTKGYNTPEEADRAMIAGKWK